MPSPSTASICPPASSPIRRPPARSRCSINPATRSAAIFYTAFVAKSASPAPRPVTFVFNGGPGAASAFLNLGLVGPRIAEFGMNGRDGSNVHLIDNPDTWLAFTDLVLIDPVGTGWSRAAKPDGGRAFWGVRTDAAIHGEGRSRSTSPRTAAPLRRNSSSAKAMAAFAPPRSRACCRTIKASCVSGILMLSPLLEGALRIRRRPLRARRRAATAVARRGRARAQRHLQQGRLGASRAFRARRII